MAEGDVQLDNAFLQLENAFLHKFLERVWPEGLLLSIHNDAGAGDGNPADAGGGAAATGGEALLLAEKMELCAVEANTTRKDIEHVQLDGDLEHACTLAAISDCRVHRAGETARDLSTLLGLLGLPEARPAGAPGASAAAKPTGTAGPSTSLAAGEGTGPTAAPPSSTAAVGLPLPSAKQLSKANLSGPQLEQYMQDILARHDAAVERLQMRNAMLKSQLGKVERQLAQRADVGATLRKVDYDQLRIEHSQAEAALAAASSDAVALKAQVVKAQQHLADQRAALAAAGAAAEQLGKQLGVREAQVAQLQADGAKVQQECQRLEAECQQLREQRQAGSGAPSRKPAVAPAAAAAQEAGTGAGSAGVEGATILDYMRVKNACAETSKKIADWQRKIEVQAGRCRAAQP